MNEGKNIYWVVFSTAEESLPANMPKNTLEKEFIDVTKKLNLNKNQYLIKKFHVRKLHEKRQEILELLVKNPNEIFNEAISMENNRREGNQPITNWINVKKNNNTSLVIKKTPSKNLSKYYLGDEEVDFDKLGDLDEKKKSKNNKSKLYLEL